MDEFGLTPIFWAIYERNDARINDLIQKGADVNYSFNTDVTDEIERAHPDYLGCDIHNSERWGCPYSSLYRGLTPLAYASFIGCLQTVQALVTAGAKFEGRSYFGRTPLTWAIEGGNVDVARFFLDLGGAFDLNEDTDHTGCPFSKNPLVIALYSGLLEEKQEEMIGMLIERGAVVTDHIRKLCKELGKSALLSKFCPEEPASTIICYC